MSKHKRPSKSRAEVKAEMELEGQKVLLFYFTVRKCVKYACSAFGVWAFAYYGIYKGLEVSAGKDTNVNYIVSFLEKSNGTNWILLIALAVSVVWAIGERLCRLRDRKTKDSRITLLEQQIDPGRTSSGLSITGESVNK